MYLEVEVPMGLEMGEKWGREVREMRGEMSVDDEEEEMEDEDEDEELGTTSPSPTFLPPKNIPLILKLAQFEVPLLMLSMFMLSPPIPTVFGSCASRFFPSA